MVMFSTQGLFSMTTPQAIWAIGGMLVGGLCWVGGIFQGYQYSLSFGAALQALDAFLLIGGVFGWIAAKVLRVP
jgi:hypothetical protein